MNPFKALMNFLKKLFDSSLMESDYLRLQQEVLRLLNVRDGQEFDKKQLREKIVALEDEIGLSSRVSRNLIEELRANLAAECLKNIALANDNAALKKHNEDLLIKNSAQSCDNVDLLEDYRVIAREYNTVCAELSAQVDTNKKQAAKLARLRKKSK